MELKLQKRLAADIMNCSGKRVRMDTGRLEEIKEAITKADMRSLISEGIIVRKPIKGISKGRARKIALQKRKGGRKGPGSRKGAEGARNPRKQSWIRKIRVQRRLINLLKHSGIISKPDYRMLYSKSKGGFFRSVRHIKLYIDEHGLAKKDNAEKHRRSKQ